jgi:hypothetical protein
MPALQQLGQPCDIPHDPARFVAGKPVDPVHADAVLTIIEVAVAEPLAVSVLYPERALAAVNGPGEKRRVSGITAL